MSILGWVFILLMAFYLLLQSSAVQTYLVGKLTESLSRKYQTSITIKGVSVAFFNKVVLEDVLVEDQKGDSLLFVHELKASIHSFNIKKRTAGINKLELNDPLLKIRRDSVGRHNYQFLVDLLVKKDTSKISKPFDFNLKRFEFNNASVGYTYTDSTGERLIELKNITLGLSDMDLQNERYAFTITNFQFNDHKDFRLEEFSARFTANADSINLMNMHTRTSNSEITHMNVTLYTQPTNVAFDPAKLKINLDLKKSNISLIDVGMMVPGLRGMNENIQVSGQVSGTLADLKGKNIFLSMGDNTQLLFDLYLNGLPNIAETYMHVDLKQSFADFKDLSKVRLPESFPLKQLKLPVQLLDAGIIEYEGNFTGFLSDFVAYGTFKSKWGKLITDLSFVPSDDEKLKVSGKVQTQNFKLGKLLKSDMLSDITFKGNIQGILDQQRQNFSAKVEGKIDSVGINNYAYKNVHLDGEIHNKKFDGNMLVDDPNLKLTFNGKFDLNVPVPAFNFQLQLEKADLRALNLDHTFQQSQLSFALDANFTGSSIDDLDGSLHFSKGTYKNENDSVSFKNFNIKTFYDDEPVLLVRSDFMDADIQGQYQLHNIHNSVKQIINKHLPAAGFSFPTQKTRNIFDFKFVLKDINRFTKVLYPDLTMNPAVIEGHINSVKSLLTFNASFPEIQYQSTKIRKLTVNVDGNSKLNIRNKAEEITIGKQFKIYNLSILSEAAKNKLDSKVAWNNYGAVSYSGSINTNTTFFKQKNSPHVEISVKPTKIFVADSLWQVNPSLIIIDSTQIRVDNFKLSNKGQSVLLDGSINKNQEEKLNVQFNEIDINWLNNFVAGNLRLKGKLNGSLSVFDIYQKALFLSDLHVEGFGLLGQPIGNAIVQSYWDPGAKEINAALFVDS
ncbi:MAG: hypothetical protein H7X84_13105, partial [Verrucomicrobia bacterium]|nr:hypothetical protein [Prolixibacteraceae bacterium]